MLVKVEGGQFVKDTKNKALLTVNRAAIEENEARKKLASRINSKNDEINMLKSKVESLSTDISDIKSLLKQLVKQTD
jgi:seryl-tRNA synthetase